MGTTPRFTCVRAVRAAWGNDMAPEDDIHLPQGEHSEWYRQCRTGTGKHFHP